MIIVLKCGNKVLKINELINKNWIFLGIVLIVFLGKISDF